MFKGNSNGEKWKFYLVFELPGDTEDLVVMLRKLFSEYTEEQIREAIEKRVVSPSKVRERLISFIRQL